MGQYNQKKNLEMMNLEQFNLNWHTYSDHLKEMMATLMNSNKSADVTLVCDDKTKFKAHKFVLSACSPVFQSIIDDLPHEENSYIFLKGIQPQEMKSILQFMYLGQATFYQDRMNKFLNAAKSLEIKEISKTVESEDVDKRGQENDENNQIENSFIKDKSSMNENYVLEEIGQTDPKVSNYKNEAGQYQCDKCERKFSYSSHLHRHIKSIHEGVRLACKNCHLTFTQKESLRRHIKNIHEFPSTFKG